MTFVAVAVGGAVGAVARYSVSVFMIQQLGAGFPWGTLTVNLIGCFLLGLVDGVVTSSPWISPELRLVVGTGFLGAFTTFSTFSLETVRTVENGHWVVGGGYVGASLIGGVALAALGIALATRVVAGG